MKTHQPFCSFWTSWAPLAGASLAALLAFCPKSSAQVTTGDLTKLNIEDLMKVEAGSVSKREQALSESADAVFVISPDDIGIPAPPTFPICFAWCRESTSRRLMPTPGRSARLQRQVHCLLLPGASATPNAARSWASRPIS